VARLTRAGCVAADDEAAALLAAVPSPSILAGWVDRREQGEPLAWIIGTATFCGHAVRVDPGVYVPRWHTELLAAEAARRLPPDGRAADLCTGAGAIAVHLRAAVPGAHVIGVDRDPVAVRCARRNGVAAVVGHAGTPLAADAFDVVTAVAPYVPTNHLPLLARDVRRYEPAAALDGGCDGLAVVRPVIADAARLLHLGGSLLLEIGGDQLDPVSTALTNAGFVDVDPWADEDGDLRGVAAVLATRTCRPTSSFARARAHAGRVRLPGQPR